MIRRVDPNGLITKKTIEWAGSASQTESTYTATSAAYKGRAWECYTCHREFGSSASLNAHANSSVHRQKIYRCPNRCRKRKCGKEFVSLTGGLGHLESERCGFLRFGEVQAVQKRVEDAMEGRRMIEGFFFSS